MDWYFTIDSTSGVIRTSRPLDRETTALHNITVVATEICEFHPELLHTCVLMYLTSVCFHQWIHLRWGKLWFWSQCWTLMIMPQALQSSTNCSSVRTPDLDR